MNDTSGRACAYTTATDTGGGCASWERFGVDGVLLLQLLGDILAVSMLRQVVPGARRGSRALFVLAAA